MDIITWADKVTGDQVTAADMAQIKAGLNSFVAIDTLTGSSDTWVVSSHKFAQRIAPTSNFALTVTITSPDAGLLTFKQDATGSRTLTINGQSVEVDPDANAVTLIGVTYIGTNLVITSNYSTGGGADTAPSAPLNLVATADSSSVISLVWDAPSSNGGSAITGYRIDRRSPAGSGSYTTIVADTGNTDTDYSNTGLSASTEYEYQVYAINAIGTSAASTADSVTTDASGGGTVDFTTADISTINTTPPIGLGTAGFALINLLASTKVTTAGTATEVVLNIGETTGASDEIIISVWRKDGSTYDVVGSELIMGSELSVGLNTIAISSPFAVLVGDYLGFHVGTYTGAALGYVPAAADSSKYTATGAPASTNVDWDAGTSFAAYAAIKLRGTV